MSDTSPHIGTLREKPLHASLKRWCARPGDRIECPVAGYVIDLVRDDLLIEVQTRGFSSMKQKVTSLLELGYSIRIVHPVPAEKWIVKLDGDGTVLSRRRSPKRCGVPDVFAELVSFPELLSHRGLEIEVVLTIEEEYRTHTTDRAWRRRGWVVIERRLVEVVDATLLGDVGDFAALLPETLPDRFTTGHLAAELGRPLRLAQQMAYCFRKAGVLDVVGKQGNSVEYRRR